MKAHPSAVFALLMPATLLAQTPLATERRTETAPVLASLVGGEAWTVRLQPRVWYAAPAGDLRLGGAAPGTAATELNNLGADEPEVSPEFNLTFRSPRRDTDRWGTAGFWSSGWDFTVGGAVYSGDTDAAAPAGGLTIGGLTIAGGSPVSTDIDWSTFSAEIGKWITGSDFGSGGETRIDLYALAGLRVHALDVSVRSAGSTAEGSEVFFGPAAGVRLAIDFPADFAAELEARVNYFPGDGGGFGFELAPAFTWRPTPNLGLQIGYRLLGADLERGEESDADYFQLDGSLAGLFGGIEIRF